MFISQTAKPSEAEDITVSKDTKQDERRKKVHATAPAGKHATLSLQHVVFTREMQHAFIPHQTSITQVTTAINIRDIRLLVSFFP